MTGQNSGRFAAQRTSDTALSADWEHDGAALPKLHRPQGRTNPAFGT